MSTHPPPVRRLLFALWGAAACAFLVVYYQRLAGLLSGDADILAALVSDGLFERWMLVPAGTGLLAAWLSGRTGSTLAQYLRSHHRVTVSALLLAAAGGVALVLTAPVIRFPGFPHAGEAALRSISALLGASAVLLTGWGIGRLILRVLGLHPEGVADTVLLAVPSGLGVLALLSLPLMAAGLYSPVALLVVSGGGAGAVIVAGVARRTERPPPPGADGTSGKGLQGTDRVWAGVAGAAITVGLVGALAPETEYDALWYHLWLPKLWLEKGQLVDLVHEYISLYPSNWELLFAAGLAAGGQVAAKLLHFACLPLLALLVHRTSGMLFPDVSPWPAVAITTTIPLLLWETTTAYVDLALTLYAGLVLYAAVRWARTGALSWLLFGACNLGFALGTKHLALFVALLATVGILLHGLRKRRPTGEALPPALLFGMIGFLLASFWYVRSALASGNPFFPDLYAVFGAVPEGRWSDVTEEQLAAFKAGFGRPRTVWNLLALPLDLVLHGARYGGAIGPVMPLLLPLALVLPPRRIVGGLLATAGLYAALWASPVSSFQARFLLPVLPIAAMLAGVGAAVLLESSGAGRTKWITAGALAGLLLLHLPPFISLHERDREGWSGWLTHVVRRMPASVVFGRESGQTYIARHVPSVPAWEFMEHHLAADARVLTFSGGDHFYSTRDRLQFWSTLARGATYGATPDAIPAATAELRRLGITHVLYDRRMLERRREEPMAMTEPAFFRTVLDTMYADARFLLCALRPPHGVDRKNASERTAAEERENDPRVEQQVSGNEDEGQVRN